ANAAMRSIVRRDTGESYEEFLKGLARESGIATPTREDGDGDTKAENILKCLLIHVGAFNLSLIFRSLLGAGTPRELRNRLAKHFSRLFCVLCRDCGR